MDFCEGEVNAKGLSFGRSGGAEGPATDGVRMVFLPSFATLGGDLGKLIKERKRQHKPFSEVTLRTWLLQLCVALDYMHKQKILHRGQDGLNRLLSLLPVRSVTLSVGTVLVPLSEDTDKTRAIALLQI